MYPLEGAVYIQTSPLAPGERAPEDTLVAIRRLRYEVYCLERGFVAPDDCPDGLEIDPYDAHAIHFAARDGEGRLVATVRLVPHGPLGFPLERYAQGFYPEFDRIPRTRTAELSRLIVARSHRRETLRDPSLLAGLLRAAYRECSRLGLDCVLAAMEGSLSRLLRHLGFNWKPIGAPIDYFGEVVPFVATMDELRPACNRLIACSSRVSGRFHYFRVNRNESRAGSSHPGPGRRCRSRSGHKREDRRAGRRRLSHAAHSAACATALACV